MASGARVRLSARIFYFLAFLCYEGLSLDEHARTLCAELRGSLQTKKHWLRVHRPLVPAAAIPFDHQKWLTTMLFGGPAKWTTIWRF